ncbi:transporter substrate-binding domain-containing protein [Grimontia kaedaensis]|uniref:Transporter substrate-binding domain-containing protein n=1 Tax=Grimontia kaedaensis TaxID=2872157 RepID=A0ABY4X180_9GAMM|nr:transporter substrate-binding domain-containing protein [Grimontia kaedaensis]USH04988.1 transporter substrate-binding domain-containing protein [Grimontia kaedaensis]
MSEKQSIIRTVNRVIFYPLLLSLFSAPVSAAMLDYFVIQDQAEPLQIQDKGKNHRGIVTDVLKQAFKGTEHQIVIHTYPFNRYLAELNKNKDKNWVTYGSPAWGDMQAANLSKFPILEVEHSILSRTDSEFVYQTPEDLNGKIAVLLFGFDYPGLEEQIRSGSVSEVRVKNYDSAFRVVDRLKNVGGFVEMDLRLKYHLKRLGYTQNEYTLFEVNNLIPKYNIHLAYSPGISPEIQQFMDKRIQEMRDNGELASIIGGYL